MNAPDPAPVADTAVMSVEGRAFTRMVKGLSTLLVAGIAYYFWLLRDNWLANGWSSPGFAFVLATLVAVVWGWVYILLSRTRIDATHICQTWLWRKQVALADITQLKFIHIAHLTWLISPRLVVRTGVTGWYVFYAGEPALVNVFLRLQGRA